MRIDSGLTNISIYLELKNITTGAPELGLDITTLDLTYVRNGAVAVKNDMVALAAAGSVHLDFGGFEVDAANCPGLYRVDIPDAAIISGVNNVKFCVNGTLIAPAYQDVEINVLANQVDAIFAETVAGKTFAELLKILLALPYGKVTDDGAQLTWYDPDNPANVLFIMAYTSNTRTKFSG